MLRGAFGQSKCVLAFFAVAVLGAAAQHRLERDAPNRRGIGLIRMGKRSDSEGVELRDESRDNLVATPSVDYAKLLRTAELVQKVLAEADWARWWPKGEDRERRSILELEEFNKDADQEALIKSLAEYVLLSGVPVKEDTVSPTEEEAESPWSPVQDKSKRSMSMIRMGKRAMALIRMGKRDQLKRSMSLIRMGKRYSLGEQGSEQEKRSMGLIRMGKKSMGLIRMGKKSMGLIRMGKKSMGLIRMGKKSMGLIRMGKKAASSESVAPAVYVPAEDKRSMSLIRMGRSAADQ